MDHLHPCGQLVDMLFATACNRLAIQHDATFGRGVDAGCNATQRGLAAAGLAHDANDFTLCNGQRDVRHGMDGTARTASGQSGCQLVAQRGLERKALGHMVDDKKRIGHEASNG